MNTLRVESRALNIELRAEQSERGRIITGRPIVYERRANIGPFDEIIERGALDGTDLTDVLLSTNHDLSKIPLARSRRNNGNSTLRLMPDGDGLQISALLDTENNADARALYSAVERGDIDGMSFIFFLRSTEDEAWDDLDTDHPTRRIKRIARVIEVSAVNSPAYPQTEINARDKQALENARTVLERAREKRSHDISPEGELELARAKFEFIRQLGGN